MCHEIAILVHDFVLAPRHPCTRQLLNTESLAALLPLEPPENSASPSCRHFFTFLVLHIFCQYGAHSDSLLSCIWDYLVGMYDGNAWQGLDKESPSQLLNVQLLKAVEWLHSRSVMHRDLKLCNLLLTKNGNLKLCDFGLARYFSAYDERYTPGVVTLWYR